MNDLINEWMDEWLKEVICVVGILPVLVMLLGSTDMAFLLLNMIWSVCGSGIY